MSQFRALVTTFLRIAWRGPAATDGARRRRGALAWGFLGYLVVGALMMLPALFLGDPRLVGVLVHSMSFVMIALAFLNIYGDLVFDARDVPILFWRPLGPRAYLAARLVAIAAYFAAVATALNLPAAVVLAFRFGPIWYPLAHLLGAFVGALAALVLALLLLFALLRTIGRERLRDAVAWVQIGATFLFVAGNQLFGRGSMLEDFSAGSMLAGTKAFLLPFSWAQALTDTLSLRALPGEAGVMAFGLAATLGACAVLVLLFARTYGDILRALGEGDARREAPSGGGRVRRAFERAAAGDPVSRAGFLLAWATIRRARDYKVRVLPQFGLPVVFGVMIAFQEFPPMSGIVTAMLALAACNALFAVAASEHAEAGWVWGVAPGATPGRALRGASLAVLGALVLPVLVLLGAGAAYLWGPARALGFSAVSAAVAVGALAWTRALVRRFPCTMSLEEGRRHQLGIQSLGILLLASIVAGVDAALSEAAGPWVSFAIAAPLLYAGWKGLAPRRYA